MSGPRFPDFPDLIRVPEDVVLRTTVRGAGAQLHVIAEDDDTELEVTDGATLEIGAESCYASEHEKVAPTAVSDRVCADNVVCTPTQFETSAQSEHDDRVCQDWRVCNSNTEYQTKAGGSHSDRECAALTTCTMTEWESVPPTSTSNRICSPHTTCTSTEWATVRARCTTHDPACSPASS